MVQTERLGTVMFLVAIMLLAPIAGAVGSVGATDDPDDRITTEGDMITDEETNISVWNHAPLSLAANTDDATDTLNLPRIDLRADTLDEQTTLQREEVGVYEADEEVAFTFGYHDNANVSDFVDDSEELGVLRGYLTESADEEDLNLSEIPMSGQELVDALTQENLDNLNENVTFKLDDDPDMSEVEDGAYEYTNSTDDTGYYTYIVTDGLTSDDVNDGDLDSVTDTSILGADQIVAHEGSSSPDVTTSSPEPGDNITVDVNADALEGESDINHAVALYDSETLTDSSTTSIMVNVTEELSTDFEAEDVVLEHNIAGIDGVHTLDEDVEFLGQSLEERQATGSLGIDQIINFIASEGEFDDEPKVDGPDEGEGVTIFGSSNATVAPADTEITIETNESWDDGDYQLVHYAMGSSSDQVQAGTDTVTIEEDTDDGPGFSPPPSDPDPVQPTASISIDPDPADIGEEITFSAADSSADGGEITDYKWLIDGDEYKGDTATVAFDEPGTYDVELTVSTADAADTATDTVTVREPSEDPSVDPEDPDDDDDDDDDGIPGFGVTAAVVALLSIALLARLR